MADGAPTAAQLRALAALLAAGGPLCAFTGAGFSCPSGIPDFRSANGIFSRREGLTLPPEEIVSHRFFHACPQEFYAFYRTRMVWPQAQPNAAHRWLAWLEAQGLPVTVVTQNIDGLHQAAGSRHVLELHGSIHRNRCLACGRRYGLDVVLAAAEVPRCPVCGGLIKPDVVLYGEPLEEDTVAAAVQALRAAGAVLVAGTSLAVYPAASFLGYYGGDRLAVVNLEPTPMDGAAALAIYADVEKVALGMQALGWPPAG